ncbi:MAG: hypothetical protein AB7N76_02815 [Planctomycetota bacterium]
MGRNRGAKKLKKGKFAWGNRKANCGRKGAQGKSHSWPTWKEVRAHMLRRATKIVVPPKAEEAAAE